MLEQTCGEGVVRDIAAFPRYEWLSDFGDGGHDERSHLSNWINCSNYAAMRLGKRLHKETARLDDTHLNVLEIDWRVFRDHSDACSKKNRIISRLASGPRGSVYDPTVFPPDQAWPPPCSTHCSRTGFPRSPT
jgi:hypothetical protein